MEKKIGLDFHGVISANPADFSLFCHEIRQLGVKVYIISGGPKEDIKRYLEKYHISYDEIWAIIDECEIKGEATFYDDGSFFVPTEIWDKAKAIYCAKEGIQFHIDDSSIYGKYFVTPYCKYDICGSYCEMGKNLRIDFSHPKEAAKQIAQLLA